MILWLASCGPPTLVTPDVLLVTLDTTRADRLGAYGASDARTPVFDDLAAAGTRFDAAFSPIPLTVPAHASLFTGRYPARLGVHANGDAALAPGVTTLAERLQEAGYVTGAAVGAFVTSRVWGFDQGFASFDDDLPGDAAGIHTERPASQVLAAALRFEERTRSDPAPRFLWAHFYDAHEPNDAHVPGFEDRPYDGQIAVVDQALGELIAGFRRRPTLVVVVADHGESLGEHGERTHGLFVYDATQRVPFVAAGPGFEAGRVVTQPVSLVDVAPTMLAALGLPPLPDPDGEVVPGEARPLFLESWQLAQRFALAPHLGVIDGPLKLIATPIPELYDRANDPGEARDLSADRPDEVRRLTALVEAQAWTPPAASALHDPDIATQLSALGYVVGAPVPKGVLPDPKHHLALWRGTLEVDRLAEAGRWSDADRLLVTLLERYPNVSELAIRRAWSLLRQGELEAATQWIDRAVAASPDDPVLRLALAARLAGEGRFAEAAALYEAAATVPWMGRARAMALAAWLDASDAPRAVELGVAFTEAHPTDAAVAGLTGIALIRVGRLSEAMPLLQRGVTAEIPERGVAFYLSAAAAGQGDRDRALALLDRELEFHPGNAEAVAARCAWHQRDRAYSEMVVVADRALSRRPTDPYALHCRAAAAMELADLPAARAFLDRALVSGGEVALLVTLDAELLRREGHVDRALLRRADAERAASAERERLQRRP